MTWMASARPSIFAAGDSAGPPSAAISSSTYPAPSPRMNRPPESRSSDAASLATMAGRRNGTAHHPAGDLDPAGAGGDPGQHRRRLVAGIGAAGMVGGGDEVV